MQNLLETFKFYNEDEIKLIVCSRILKKNCLSRKTSLFFFFRRCFVVLFFVQFCFFSRKVNKVRFIKRG